MYMYIYVYVPTLLSLVCNTSTYIAHDWISMHIRMYVLTVDRENFSAKNFCKPSLLPHEPLYHEIISIQKIFPFL